MKSILSFILISFLFLVPVCAEEDIELINEEGVSDVPTTEEVYQTFEYNFILSEPIATYQVNPDDIITDPLTRAISGDVYQGSINSTVLTAWEGIIANNIGKEYIGFRGSQYDYYLFVGDGFSYNGSTFTGSGTKYTFNTNQNLYTYSISQDSFNIRPASYYVYTNVSKDYPRLANEGGLLYAYLQNVCLFVLIGFNIIKWIFTKR